MGKKNKKEKKGQGKEKTLQKAEKNAKKRAKKELAEKGEDDIEQMIAEFKEQDKKRTQVIEEKCPPPSPRCSMSLTPHPDKEELLMFGGEYFTGNMMYMYNDLYVYNTKKNEWLKVSAPNSPPPRSSHQAVALRQGGGQLWLFGGEFASPSQSQFYHYKDLWVFHLKDKKWEKISAPGGPSSRSGHRMVHCKKQLIVFGGFHDNIRDYKYFNDAYAFNLDTYTWVQLTTSGIPPAPRSGCIMTSTQDQTKVIVYGGYSKEKVKKEVATGKVHTDMFALMPEGKVKEDTQPVKWKWVSMKQTGARPTPRSGLSLAYVGNNKAVCFGGVFDEEENEEQLQGKFYNNLYMLEVDKGKWYEVALKGKKTTVEKKKRRKKKEAGADGDGVDADVDADDDDDENIDDNEDNVDNEMGEKTSEMDIDEEELKKLALDTNGASINDVNMKTETDSVPEVTMEEAKGNDNESQEIGISKSDSAVSMETDESVFKLTIGEQTGSNVEGAECDMMAEPVDVFVPHPRMNTMMAVKNGVLYLYGGIFEDGDRQYTLSDMYSLDTNKMDEWNILIKTELKDQVWEGSDSSSSEDDDDVEGAAKRRHSDSDDDDDDDDEIDLDFSDAPERPASESVKDYFERTKDYWISKAQEYCDAEDMKLPAKKLEKLAKEMCQEAF